MKFAETPISQQYTIYLKDEIRTALKLDAGDTLEWHVDGDEVKVRKKGEVRKKP